MDMKELWSKACVKLQEQMNKVTYLTWIKDNLTPVALEEADGDKAMTLIMQISIENLQMIITKKYRPLIESVLSEIARQPVVTELYTKAELAERAVGAPAVQNTPAMGDMSIHLNPRYTFDSFVVGNNNRFAHAAALAVAEMQGEVYNPLFIYGGVGLGKTHLMHAIGHFVQDNYPEKKLMYITCEDFTNDLITSIQLGKNQQFRERFRNVDYLMVDDIQFIAGKESTQEEFFHTFNTLQSAGKQIVLTSDRPPLEIAKLSERLSSRFAGGLTCDIKKPDIETRTAILRRKAQTEHLDVGDDVLELIAANVDSNIRELEGCLTRVIARSQFSGNAPVTVELARDELKDMLDSKRNKEITPRIILETVASYYSLAPEDLTGSSRRKDVVVPRQIAIYLTREMLGTSLPQIGQIYGGRDHTTILHSCEIVKKSINDSASYSSRVGDIRTMINE